MGKNRVDEDKMIISDDAMFQFTFCKYYGFSRAGPYV